jgi:hypothetical protein
MPPLKDKFKSKKTTSPIRLYAFPWFKNLAINIKHLLKYLKMPKNNVFLQDILTTRWFLLTGPGPNITCKQIKIKINRANAFSKSYKNILLGQEGVEGRRC